MRTTDRGRRGFEVPPYHKLVSIKKTRLLRMRLALLVLPAVGCIALISCLTAFASVVRSTNAVFYTSLNSG